jgi:hypothetical protein
MTSIDERLRQELQLDGVIPQFDTEGNLVEFEPLAPAVLEITEKPSSLDKLNLETDIVQDYKAARNLNYTLMKLMGDALAGAVRMANVDNHPNSYKVVNDIAMTMIDLSKELVGLQKTFKEVIKDKPEYVPPVGNVTNNTTNNVTNFTGTTADIIAQVEQAELAREDQLRQLEDKTIDA